jgi:hypothetical protein
MRLCWIDHEYFHQFHDHLYHNEFVYAESMPMGIESR